MIIRINTQICTDLNYHYAFPRRHLFRQSFHLLASQMYQYFHQDSHRDVQLMHGCDDHDADGHWKTVLQGM